MRSARGHRDSGFTLIELLLVITLAGLVIGGAIWFLRSATTITHQIATEAEMQTQLTNASMALMVDAADASRLDRAERQRMTVTVVREGQCRIRDWTVEGGQLLVETTTFSGARCEGGSEVDRHVMIESVDDVVLTWFGQIAGDTPLAEPVQVGYVNRVRWELSGTARDANRQQKITSSAALTSLGQATDPGPRIDRAVAPVLEVVTAERGGTGRTPGIEGVHAPALRWTVPEASLPSVQGWNVFRWSYPASASGAALTARPADQVMHLPCGPAAGPCTAVTEWQDQSLPDGYTAIYYVVPQVASATSDDVASNRVETGKRPAAPASLRVAGSGTGLVLTWPASVGAQGYDVYRTDVPGATSAAAVPAMHLSWDQIKASATRSGDTWTWTDNVGYGRTHSYRVVATGRWESRATGTAVAIGTPQDTVLPLGATSGAVRAARLLSPVAGSYTAPAAPTFTAVEQAGWVNRLTRTFAGYTGSGPAGVNVSWKAEEQVSGAWTSAVASVPAGTATYDRTYTEDTIGGVNRTYRLATCNAAGCGPWTVPGAGHTAVQIPKRPASCMFAARTTYSMDVVGTYPASDSAYRGYRIAGGTKSAGATAVTFAPGPEVSTAQKWTVSGLRHNTNHVFDVRSRNGSRVDDGWSPTRACQTSTATATGTPGTGPGYPTLELAAPQITISGVTTRAMTAAASASNGSQLALAISSAQARVTSEASRAWADGGRRTWDPLQDGVLYTVNATNADAGGNTVSASRDQRTVAIAGDVNCMRANANNSCVNDVEPSTRRMYINVADQDGVTQSATMALANGDAPIEGETLGDPGWTNAAGTSWSWNPVRDGRTFAAQVRFTDGFNTVSRRVTAATELLAAPSVTFSSITTRSVVARVTADDQPGTAQRVRLSADTDADYRASGSKFDGLAHNTERSFRGRNSDGFNDRLVTEQVTTQRLAAPSCSSTLVDAVALGSVRGSMTTGAGQDVDRYMRLGTGGTLHAGTSYTWSSLVAGTYTPYAINTDGHNTLSDACTSRTIVNPAPGPISGPGEGAWYTTSSPAGGGSVGFGSLWVVPGSSSYATSYEARVRWEVGSLGLQGWTAWRTVTPGARNTVGGTCLFDPDGALHSPEVEVRAINAQGTVTKTYYGQRDYGAAVCAG